MFVSNLKSDRAAESEVYDEEGISDSVSALPINLVVVYKNEVIDVCVSIFSIRFTIFSTTKTMKTTTRSTLPVFASFTSE